MKRFHHIIGKKETLGDEYYQHTQRNQRFHPQRRAQHLLV
jgi:hypothetical protein